MQICLPTCQSFFENSTTYNTTRRLFYDGEYHNILSADLDAGLGASMGCFDTVRIGSALSAASTGASHGATLQLLTVVN